MVHPGMVPFALLQPLLGVAATGGTLSALQSPLHHVGTTACPEAQPWPPPNLHPCCYSGCQPPTLAGWECALKNNTHVTRTWVQRPFGQANPLRCQGSRQLCPGSRDQSPSPWAPADFLQCGIRPCTASCNTPQCSTHQKRDRHIVRTGDKAFQFALNPVSCRLSSPCSCPKTNP